MPSASTRERRVQFSLPAQMKYTRELLTEAVKTATSFSQLAVQLNIKPIGSTITNLAKRCKKLNVDTSHFTGQSHQKGRPVRNRLTSEELFVLGVPETGRIEPRRLRQGLLAIGIPYRCECGNAGDWLGKPLRLQVDHVNGKYWDNRTENLRFICPNCHTQTETWGRKSNASVA